MKLKVASLTGQGFDVNVQDCISVDDLKVQIANLQRVGFDQIKLLFNGQPLTAGIVSSYGIGNGSTLHLVIGQQTTIRVSLQLPNGTSSGMDVEPSEKVVVLKQKIQATYGIQVDSIELIFEGKIIQGNRLTDHNVGPGAVLVLRLKRIKINVTTMAQKKIQIEVDATETVEGLKRRLRAETGVMESQQRLVCLGRELSGSTDTLQSYGVCDGSIINMVGRLRGG